MKKPARINTSPAIGEVLRKIQSAYNRKFKPAKISLEAINDLCVEHGVIQTMKKLKLS